MSPLLEVQGRSMNTQLKTSHHLMKTFSKPIVMIHAFPQGVEEHTQEVFSFLEHTAILRSMSDTGVAVGCCYMYLVGLNS